jgi:hypothetical protein
MNQQDFARSAGRLRLIVLLLMVTAVALHIVARIGTPSGHFRIVSHLASGGSGGLPGLVSDLSTILFAIALWQLAAMLRAVSAQDYFSIVLVRRFRRFASFLLLSALASVVLPPIVSLIPQGDGAPRLVALDFRDIWTLCVAAVLFLLARLIDEARRIALDLSEIV